MIKPEEYQKWKDNQSDGYGKVTFLLAEKIMKFLDDNPHFVITNGYYGSDPNSAHAILCEQDEWHVSGFQANCTVAILENHHKRGKEFSNLYHNKK